MINRRQFGVIAIFIVFLIFTYLRVNYEERALSEKRNGFDQLTDSDQNILDNYVTLWDLSQEFKNYWQLFRSSAQGANFDDQTPNIDEGYQKIYKELKLVMNQSKEIRSKRLQQLSSFVRERITRSQNPCDCNKARLALGHIQFSTCGLGCVQHKIAGYLAFALHSNRTLVLVSKGWPYAKEGWEYAYLPLSSCTYDGGNNTLPHAKWHEFNKHDEHRVVVVVPDSHGSYYAVPTEIKKDLMEVHGHPFAWWIGQMVSYSTRLQPWLKAKLEQTSEKNSFSNEVVGVQVRWGDKIDDEARKISVENFMMHVDSWFENFDGAIMSNNRTVYVASEDEEARQEIRKKYPNYKFIATESIEKEGTMKGRFTHAGLISVIQDIYFLSRCRYLVCALSSNVCRAAYDMKLTTDPDAALNFQTVDVLYRLYIYSTTPAVALVDHMSDRPDELVFAKGDLILISNDAFVHLNDGFYRGANKRTGKTGKFPSFKVKWKLASIPVPAFQSQAL